MRRLNQGEESKLEPNPSHITGNTGEKLQRPNATDEMQSWVNNSRSKYRGGGRQSNIKRTPSSDVQCNHILSRLVRMKLLKSLIVIGLSCVVIYILVGLLLGDEERAIAGVGGVNFEQRAAPPAKPVAADTIQKKQHDENNQKLYVNNQDPKAFQKQHDGIQQQQTQEDEQRLLQQLQQQEQLRMHLQQQQQEREKLIQQQEKLLREQQQRLGEQQKQIQQLQQKHMLEEQREAKKLAEQQQLLQQQHQQQQQQQQQQPRQQQPQQQQPQQQQQQQPQQQQPVIQQGQHPQQQTADKFDYHILQSLTKTDSIPKLKKRFVDCEISILEKASVDLHFFFVVDPPSRKFIEETMQDIKNKGVAKSNFQYDFLDVDVLAKEIAPLVSLMQQHLSATHPYFKDAIFYLSVALHNEGILPGIHRVLMLDTDLKFMTDVKQLFDFFPKFTGDNIVGIAHEQQPVYRHMLSLYRSRNPGTLIGGPAPDGRNGFNSGVMLLDLDKARQSASYAHYLSGDTIKTLVDKYFFKGHLGDQDLFSLINMDKPDLFYLLPCTWNRQLCTWWRDKGYEDIFHLYHDCSGPINVYHGNCNTPIVV